MRSWCRPIHFASPKGEASIMAYRVHYADPNPHRIPPGHYLVVLLEDARYKMRILAGPHSEDVVLGRLTTATPQRLIALLEQATEGRRAASTVH